MKPRRSHWGFLLLILLLGPVVVFEVVPFGVVLVMSVPGAIGSSLLDGWIESRWMR